ncbi:hypothetical protein CHS0354_010901 [Potamilus streckersoni]|uniref:Ferric-chelate reductase 1 n=1 Tax=Potamilus streckersoni TaxID=2493646 RepID=A0AAE0VYX5_9BIVA|nr:hypothetical protein CHS0354_010901 [Potamilus streckersoni]
MYTALSLIVIFCAIRCRNVLGYSTGAPATACRDMVPRHGVIAQDTPVPFLVEVSKTRYSPNERIFVRIRGCKNNRFKGFFIQPRLAEYPDAAMFLGTFGRVGGTQYACDQNGGVLTHIDPSEKESVTLVWMAPPRPVGHVIFRVTFVQSYTKFWVGVNSPVVSDGISSELSMMKSFSLRTPTNFVCTPTASLSASRPTVTNEKTLQPVILRTIMEPRTITTTKRTTTIEKKSTSEPTSTNIRPMTTTSTTTSLTTTTTAPSTISATTNFTITTISTPTTESIVSVKPAIMKYAPNTTRELTLTATLKTASAQQPMPAMITRTTAAQKINETSQPSKTSVTHTRLIIKTTIEPLTTESEHLPLTETNRTKKEVTSTSRKTILGHIQTSQRITRTTVKYLDTMPSTLNQTDSLNLYPNIRCGSLQGCFDDCEGEFCNFIVAWQDFGTHIRFEVKKKMDTATDNWVAIGFSDDRIMGVDSVIECISESGVVKVYQSYNLENYRNVRLVEPSVGLSDEIGSLRDGILSCSFTRENKAKNEKEIFDLQSDWYLMFANGRAIQGMKLPHDFTFKPPVSEIMVDFQSYPPMHLKYKHTVAATTTADPNKSKGPSTQQIYIAPDPECGIQRSCFQNCNAFDCQFVVTWDRRDDQVIFKMRAVTLEPTNQWIAIAFSDDEKMGDDSVIQCVSDESNIIRVKQSYNKGRNNFEVNNATKGIYNVNASFIDGILSCDFTRDRIIHEEPEIFNLDQKWKLLFAQGRSKRGNILPHDIMRKPQTSEDWVDFSHNEARLISAPIIYIKFHSCLMIFTWCFAASISTILGRYFQPDKGFGSKAWSKVHRLFVVTTVLGFITGLIVMFVGVEGISTVLKHDISSFKSAHPVLGLLVTFLALLCPILLIFRPLQGTASRFVFNWIFWLVESITLILAVVTIFAGLKLSEGSIPSYLEYLIIGYAAYQVITTVVFESIRFYDVHKEREQKMKYLYELYVKPWNLTRQNSSTSALDVHEIRKSVKKCILGTHVLILAVFVLSIIIIIVRS